jgi:hypothetical protein
MKQFDHLSIFVSMIIALGVRHLILSVASMIHLRGKVKIYYPTVVWMITLLLLLLQIWWVFFYRHDNTNWSYFAFLLYLFIPITLSMLSHLILPEFKEGIDLEVTYTRNRKWFFGLLASVAFVSLFEDYLRSGIARLDLNFWFRVLFIALSIAGVYSGSKRLQLPLAITFLSFFIFYIAVLFLRLG